jgi:uncharacterized protein (DUF302 family)
MTRGFGTIARRALLALGLALAPALTACADMSDDGMAPAAGNGVVTVKSAYGMAETVQRLKDDVAAKGIMFFQEIDQSQLASTADIALRPSTLLIFGNPPLGTQFLTSNPESGLDWPVRLLVFEDADGQVWAAYTDFEYIRQRHGIADRDAQFKMASEVIASITSTVKTTE